MTNMKPRVSAVKLESNGKRGKNDAPYNTTGIAGDGQLDWLNNPASFDGLIGLQHAQYL